MMEAFCSCAAPDLVREDFHGSSQSVCQGCGNVRESIDMVSQFGEGFHVATDQAMTVQKRKFIDLLTTYAGKLALPAELKKQVQRKGEKVWDCCRCKRNKDAYAVATIAVVMLKGNESPSLNHLCSTFGVRVIDAKRAYKEVTGEQYMEVRRSPLMEIRELCKTFHGILKERLRHPPTLKQITDLSSEIYELVKGDFYNSNFRLPYFSASVCHMACKRFSPQAIHANDVIKLFSLARTRYATISTLVAKALTDLADKIPWKPKHINFKNIYMFLPDILEFCAPSLNDISICLDDPGLIKKRKRAKIDRALARLQAAISGNSVTQVLGDEAAQECSENGSTSDPETLPLSTSNDVTDEEVEQSNSEKAEKVSVKVRHERQEETSSVSFRILNRQRKRNQAAFRPRTKAVACKEDGRKSTRRVAEVIDAEDQLIEDLLSRGCCAEDIMEKPYSQLSKSYLDFDSSLADDKLELDDEISDTELESYCLTPEEIEVRVKKLKAYYS